ncbi:MAG: HDIG domain-containing protein, partial [Sphaerospermopsis sp. SIO1G2]|nr:HDIG domain-containing protein [Sphaerospermopsis sp. SIO1G2]
MSDITSTAVSTRTSKVSRQDQLALLVFVLTVSIALTLILGLDFTNQQQVMVSIGERTAQNIVAPQSISYESVVLTEKRRSDTIANIYRYTLSSRDIGTDRFNQARDTFRFIETVRVDQFAERETQIRYIQAIDELEIDSETAALLLDLSQTEFNTAKNETLSIIAEVMQQDIRPEDLRLAQESVSRRIGFDLNPSQEQVVASITPQFIVPNIFFDEEATNQARAEASLNIEPIMRVITEGELIVRVGEIVEEDDLEALEQLGLLQEENNQLIQFGGSFLAAVIASTILALYWWRYQRKTYRPLRYLALLAILLVTSIAVARATIATDLFYFFPAAAFAMLIAVIADTRLSIMVTVIMAGLIGYMSDNQLEFAVYTAVGSFISCLALQNTQRFQSFFTSGLLGAGGNLAVILLFNFSDNLDLTTISYWFLSSLSNGLGLVPITTIAGFFFVGLFGITTVVQLQDLSRLNHPLLQELLRRAPGTYHHSIMVANLAEQAAERIGANGTLVRVGSFYHDIGKMNRPPFFTENQEGSNPHDTLDPYTSARIITAHVTEGLALAQKYRLPQRLQDFIAEHHGTRVVKVFFERAKQIAEEGEEVDINKFCYAGPRPRSRETAIVLLADTVEAASSAIRPSTAEEIEKLVDSLVDDHLRA